MLEEELPMLLVLVELLGRQHDGEHGDAGFELHLHEARDDCLGDELVTIDAAVDDEPAGNDGSIAMAAGEQFGVQRNLERAGHLEEIYGVTGDTKSFHAGE